MASICSRLRVTVMEVCLRSCCPAESVIATSMVTRWAGAPRLTRSGGSSALTSKTPSALVSPLISSPMTAPLARNSTTRALAFAAALPKK